MHGLPPTPAVARATQPAPPERHGRVELGRDLGIGVRHWHLARLDAVEQKGGGLPGPEGDARADVGPVDDLERAARREAELQLGGAEEGTVRGERDLVAQARVVEARGDVDHEAHLPAHGKYLADHAVAVRGLPTARRGHEVLHLRHSVGHQEARDEDVGVGEVELLRTPTLTVGRDAEQAPVLGVENRREDARRVKARTAVPVDRPDGADERNRVQVADQAVLGDRQVARSRSPPDPPGRDPPSWTSPDFERHRQQSATDYTRPRPALSMAR